MNFLRLFLLFFLLSFSVSGCSEFDYRELVVSCELFPGSDLGGRVVDLLVCDDWMVGEVCFDVPTDTCEFSWSYAREFGGLDVINCVVDHEGEFRT